MLIALDAGHGGSDPGAVYNGRNEKDDNLRLTMAVGEILENNGIDVFYTRDTDIYETPFKKATDANEAGADYFVSFHRNSSENPNTASGAQVLIYSPGGEKEILAENILNNLVKQGFRDLGIDIRPNLVVLKRTGMPAVLIETGFINNSSDNEKFDNEFDEIAGAIAEGILMTVNRVSEVQAAAENQNMVSDPYEGLYENDGKEDNSDRGCSCDTLYRVQTGAFRSRESAERLLYPLTDLGFPAFIIYQDGLYKVQVGAYKNLDNAVTMEQKLRRYRYNTYITT